MRTALIGVANIHDRLTLSDNYGNGGLDAVRAEISKLRALGII